MTTTNKERGRAVAKTTKVRTTLDPKRVIEVDDAELLDLTRQGLIYGDLPVKGDPPVDPETESYTEPAAEAKTDKKEIEK